MNSLRKWLVWGMLVAGLTAGGVFLCQKTLLTPRTPTELAKLFQILNVFQGRDYKVIYNGNPYDIAAAVARARGFIVSRYQGEKAEALVRNHLYRSVDKGNVIYLAFPDGSRRPLRDVLIEELQRHFPA